MRPPQLAKIPARVSKPREPLRTLEELAKEFGVTKSTLSHQMYEKKGPPPVMTTKGNLYYYSPSAVRAWWLPVKESRYKHVKAAGNNRQGDGECTH